MKQEFLIKLDKGELSDKRYKKFGKTGIWE